MNKFFVFIICISLTVLYGCSSKVSTVAFHNYQTECLGKSMDGKQVLRVWASGRNRTDAIEQAKKKAVYDVVFTGIQGGSGECNAYPVVDEANARKKYEDYFDLFFADGGAYRQYVSTSDFNKSSIDKFKGNGMSMFGITVSVNRSALRQRFISDNIIVK